MPRRVDIVNAHRFHGQIHFTLVKAYIDHKNSMINKEGIIRRYFLLIFSINLNLILMILLYHLS